ncbi:hypothetical protein CF328_g6988 [Tilletia controversa]|nr:hypothetical protein CF328_g6988 [Tilletia controversa]
MLATANGHQDEEDSEAESEYNLPTTKRPQVAVPTEEPADSEKSDEPVSTEKGKRKAAPKKAKNKAPAAASTAAAQHNRGKRAPAAGKQRNQSRRQPRLRHGRRSKHIIRS